MKATAKAPFLIIETGHPIPTMRRYGRFPHWIRVAAGLEADAAIVTNVEYGDVLPRREGFAGVIVSGSASMVTDRADWSERSAEWLRDAAHDGLPLFGICYGHQLLAHALGGEVANNPAGRRMGTVQVQLRPEARQDPLFASLPEQFNAQATHVQSVQALPRGAVLLAQSEHDPSHAFRWGEHAWGVQFHPEFATHHMRGYVHARQEPLRREGHCPRTIAGNVTAAPQARKLLRRFVKHARGLHGH